MSEGNVEAREGSYRKIPQIEKIRIFFPIDCSECLGTLKYTPLGWSLNTTSTLPVIEVDVRLSSFSTLPRREVVQLQHVAATIVILPCQNGYYDSNVKVLLIVVKEVKKLR